MKSRKVIITLEVETDAKVKDLEFAFMQYSISDEIVQLINCWDFKVLEKPDVNVVRKLIKGK